MILHYLDASTIGGIETHVETLALAQTAAGHPAAVLLHADYPQSIVCKRYQDAGLEVHVAGNFSGLVKTLRSLSPDILHTHGYKAGISGRIATQFLRLPIISTFHAGERGSGRMALYQWLDEWTSFVGGRLAVSRAIAEKMPYDTKVMRNFVEPSPRARKLSKVRRFVFAGRLSHEKGPDIFCSLARRNKHLAHFDIYGEGPMRSKLEVDKVDGITFHGFANNMKEVLRETTALLMTSRNEGLPMIALEAMAQGVPVIAPALGGLPSLIESGHNGYLYEPENLEDLGRVFQVFCSLDDLEVKAIGNAARKTIIRHYSPEVVLPEMFEAYLGAGWKSSRSTITKVQSSIG